MLDIHEAKHRNRANAKVLRFRATHAAGDPKVARLNTAPSYQTAQAYNHVGDEYGRYADGFSTSDETATTECRFAHGDSIVWQNVKSAIDELRLADIKCARILDAGCGPGVWSRRIARYCEKIGLPVEVVGFDISATQLEIARRRTQNFLSRDSGASSRSIEFREQDLSKPLPWADEYFHLALCNYTVLNHLTQHALTSAVAELCRVTQEHVIATVRAIGSPPTALITGMEHVREYRHDQSRGQLSLVLDDGSRHRVPFKLYSAHELDALFSPLACVQDLRAIDVFTGRFAADARWTSALLDSLPDRSALVGRLKEMEENVCRLPGWIDHGTHVLIVAKPRRQKAPQQHDAPAAAPQTSVASFSDYLAHTRK